MDACRAEPTEAQLRAAWAICRRADWPDTYEETMEDALLSRLVRLTAKHPPVQARIDYSRRAWPLLDPEEVRRSNAVPYKPRGKATAPTLDRKRAAAGERDDD